MATDQVHTRLYNKKILPLSAFKDRFLDYLRTLIKEAHTDMFNRDAVLGSTKAAITPTGNNQINVGAAAAIRGVSGTGFTINLAAGDSRHQLIKVPPDAAVVYDVGLEPALVETGVEVNPRTSEVEYSNFTEMVGRVTNPTSVTDNGNGTLTLNVNSLFESGKDNSGRSVRVWLKSRTSGGIGPLSPVENTAIQQNLAVVYSAPNNTVTIPNLMGQTGTPSTTAAHYMVMSVGPTVRRQGLENLRNTSGCLFLGSVTSVAAGNPIVTISTTDQVLLKYTMSQLTAEGTWYMPGSALTPNKDGFSYTKGIGGFVFPADIGGAGNNPGCAFPPLLGKQITEIRAYVNLQANTNVKIRLGEFIKATGVTSSTDSALASALGRQVITMPGPLFDITADTYRSLIMISGGTVANNVTIEGVEFDYIPIP